MKSIKKFALLLALIASVSLSSCSSEQSLNKPDTTTSTAEENKKDKAAETQEKENTDKKEDKKDDADKKEDKKDDQELTDDEKATLDEFVERLEKYENATAGASLKMDRLFTEMVNRLSLIHI